MAVLLYSPHSILLHKNKLNTQSSTHNVLAGKKKNTKVYCVHFSLPPAAKENLKVQNFMITNNTRIPHNYYTYARVHS